MPKFAADERDAVTRIFNINQNTSRNTGNQCPTNPASLKMRILSQLFTLRNFLRVATMPLTPLRTLPTPPPSLYFMAHRHPLEGSLDDPLFFRQGVEKYNQRWQSKAWMGEKAAFTCNI